MRIQVRLFSILRHRPEGLADRVELSLPDNGRVRDVLDALAVAAELEAFVAVNGVIVHDEDTVLQDGDEVSIIPAVSGGAA